MLLLASCQRDQIAPECFFVDQNGNCLPPVGPDDSGNVDLSLECGEPIDGALKANYSYTVDAFDGPDGVVWQASGLPMGLQVGMGGQIYGVPEETGTFEEIVVTMTDTDSGASIMSPCGPLTINDELGHGLGDTPAPDLAPLGCVPVGEDIMEFLTGGDGTAITCAMGESAAGDACPHDDGNGLLPDGVSFNADECLSSGSVDADHHGTYVWMVHVEQSGNVVDVPYCATKSLDTAFHDIDFTLDGDARDPLAPMVITFDPASPLQYGDSPDPQILVTEACAADSCNFWGFKSNVTCSPFDPPFEFPSFHVENGNGDRIGFQHGFDISTQGANVEDQKNGSRAWTVQISEWYCTADPANQEDCDKDMGDNVKNNAQTLFTYAVIAYPE
jgi:hypothetical protein